MLLEVTTLSHGQLHLVLMHVVLMHLMLMHLMHAQTGRVIAAAIVRVGHLGALLVRDAREGLHLHGLSFSLLVVLTDAVH